MCNFVGTLSHVCLERWKRLLLRNGELWRLQNRVLTRLRFSSVLKLLITKNIEYLKCYLITTTFTSSPPRHEAERLSNRMLKCATSLQFSLQQMNPGPHLLLLTLIPSSILSNRSKSKIHSSTLPCMHASGSQLD